MTALASKRAIVQLDVSGVDTPIGEVRSYSIETSLGTIDVSTLSTDWKKYLVGQAGWTASMELFYDPTDEAQDSLATKALAGTLCSFVFLPFDSEERYRLKLGSPTGGTFTLGDGDTIETDALDYNATAAQIQSALNTAYSETGISVTIDGGGFVIEFPSGVAATLEITTDALTYETTGTAECDLITATYTGEGYITSWTPSGATEDAVGLAVSIQGEGELVLS